MYKKTKHHISIVVLIGFLLTCFNPTFAKNNSNLQEKQYDTRVFIGDCQKSATHEFLPILIPLAIAAAPIIIPPLVSFVSDRIKGFGENFNADYSGRGSDYFYKMDSTNGLLEANNRCLCLTRGNFGDATGPDGNWTLSQLRNLGLIEAPDFYMESKLEFSKNSSSFRIKPSYLDFNKPGSKWGNKKSLSISYAFEVPDSNSKAISVSLLSIPNLKSGTFLNESLLNKYSSQWINLLPLSDLDKKTYDNYGIYLKMASLTQDLNKRPIDEGAIRYKINYIIENTKENKDFSGLSSILVNYKNFGQQDFASIPIITSALKNSLPDLDYINKQLTPFSVLISVQERDKNGDVLLDAAKLINDNKDQISKDLVDILKQASSKKTDK